MANPRIDDLRKRLEKDPGSRLFAQLAEELRKEGDLGEAILVARQGLRQHPNYPSARMTLGRALYDTGDFAAARVEFEQVLKGAPDNILASRLLGECLEHAGDRAGAIARLKATLALAPGDKQVMARLEELERAPRASAVSGAGLRGGDAAAPIKLVDVEGEMELEGPGERNLTPAPTASSSRGTNAGIGEVGRPAPAVDASARPSPPPAPGVRQSDEAPAPGPPPIPLVEADEPFELERPYEAPAVTVGISAAAEKVSAPSPPPPPAPLPTPEEATEDAAEGERPAAEPALTSPTLAELYFNQGFADKAIAVYRDLLRREPGNGRFETRLRELESLSQPDEVPEIEPMLDEDPSEEEPAPEIARSADAGAPPSVVGVAEPSALPAVAPPERPTPPAPAPAAPSIPPIPPIPPDATAHPTARARPMVDPNEGEKVQRTIARLEAFLAAVKRS